MTKRLDYNEMELFTTVKSFTIQAHGKEWVDMNEHTLKVTNNNKKHCLDYYAWN